MQLFASLGIAAGVKLTDPKQFDLNLQPEQNSLGNFIRANSSGASQEIFWREKKVAAYRLSDFFGHVDLGNCVCNSNGCE